MKKCRICRQPFTPLYLTTQSVCNQIECISEWGRIQREKQQEARSKAFRKETRIRKDKLKSRSEYAQEAQQAVNKYVRIRDRGKPCCSCDKPDDGSHQRHASHYRSTKAASSIRFNLWNIHASCQQCNTALSGNVLEYRIRLIKKIGLARVEWLESQNHAVKYEIDYLKRLKKVFNKRARILGMMGKL